MTPPHAPRSNGAICFSIVDTFVIRSVDRALNVPALHQKTLKQSPGFSVRTGYYGRCMTCQQAVPVLAFNHTIGCARLVAPAFAGGVSGYKLSVCWPNGNKPFHMDECRATRGS